MRSQAGYTLIELVIVVAIIAIVTASGIGMAVASRPSAVNAAAMRFDALVDEARTIGRQFDTGATIVFTARDPDGFNATLYRNRPSTLPLVATNTPVLVSTATITEQSTNSTPGFALAIHANGNIAMIPGYKLGVTGIGETACPASHNYQFVLSFAGHSVTRILPCAAVLATTGTPTFAPFPAAPTQTPGLPGPACTNCTSIPLPSVTPSCPPSYLFQAGPKCVPVSTSPTPTPTCPAGFSGIPPNCVPSLAPPSPTASPGGVPPCTPDKLGYCWFDHSSNIVMAICGNVDGWHTAVPSGEAKFSVYSANGSPQIQNYEFLASYFDPTAEGDDQCYTSASWIGGDPTQVPPNDPATAASIASQLAVDLQGTSGPQCVNEQSCEQQ